MTWVLRRKKYKYFLLALIGVTVFVLFQFNQARAAVVTWDNDSLDGLWSTCTNWSGDACPGSGDVATFDGSTTTDSVIDNGVGFGGSVAGVDINSGYTGTITQQRDITINASHFAQDDGTFKQGTYKFTINSNGSFTLSGGTFETGISTTTIQNDFTISGGTYTASSTSVVQFGVQDNSSDTVITCSGVLPGLIDINKNNVNASFAIASGCEVNTVDSISNGNSSITNNGTLNFGSSVSLQGQFTNNGTTTTSGTTMTMYRNLTQNGVFDLSGVTITFEYSETSDDTTISCTGDLGGLIALSKGSSNGTFALNSGCNVIATTTTNNGSITINGTLSIAGTTFTNSTTFTIGASGTFRLYGDETITVPTLSAGATVDYYGSGTYSSLLVGYDYDDLLFSGGGTYNIANDINVSSDLLSSGSSSLNQTSGTFTLDGTGNQTITGTSTFNKLTKAVTAAATLFFGADQTQTVTDRLTITGTSGNILSLDSTAGGTKYKIDMQGIRTLQYLNIQDANNTNAATAYCDTGCTDGTGNTNITFGANPDGNKVYWDNGGGDSNWSTCANWTFNTCPTSADTAAFDSRSTTVSTLDASFAGIVSGLFIENGYTNTITSNRSLTVGSDGFTLADGTFVAPAATLAVNGSFTHTDGTYTHNSGTVGLSGTGTLAPTTTTAFNDTTFGGSHDSSLVGYWKVDESTGGGTIEDDTTNGYDGTPVGDSGANVKPQPTTTVPSTVSFTDPYALDFDGTDDYFYASPNIPTGDFTYTVWVYLDSTADEVIFMGANTSGQNELIFRVFGGVLNVFLDNGERLVSGGAVSTGQWYHLALRRSASTINTFINGSITGTDSYGTALNFTGCEILIGADSDSGCRGGTLGNWFSGRMDDIRIYSTALTDTQIESLANGFEFDNGLNSANTTLSSTTLDVNGTLTLKQGSTLDVSATGCSGSPCAIEVAGDWTGGGTFTGRSGTVTFDGTSQTISGDTTFNNFTKSVGSADTITFAADSTQTISSTLILKGTAGNILTLNSGTPGSQWKLNANTYASTVEYLNVNDSNSINTTNSMYCFPGCSNGGGNTNWVFESRPDGRQLWRIDGGLRIQGDTRYGQ